MDWKLEARIRERAYQIWEREGRPEGRDFDHWTRAVSEVQAEEEGGQPKAAAPRKAKAVNGNGAEVPKVSPGAMKKSAAKKAKPASRASGRE